MTVVDVNGEKLKGNRSDPLRSLEQMQQRDGIFASRKRNQDTIPLVDQGPLLYASAHLTPALLHELVYLSLTQFYLQTVTPRQVSNTGSHSSTAVLARFSRWWRYLG